MTELEKQQKAKEVADHLRGDVITFELYGQKYVYHKGLAEKEAEFERARKKQLYQETGDLTFLS